MRRRIFITVSLEPFVKKRLFQKTEKWADLPVKWVSAENFHITLIFLGYVDNERVLDICSSIRSALNKAESFEINLGKITTGPSQLKPRMIWATGEKSPELKNLVELIEKSLGIFMANKKEFCPHITLGRIRHEKWVNMEPPPQINEAINFVVPVGAVEILESIAEKGKRKYLLLESCPLK